MHSFMAVQKLGRSRVEVLKNCVEIVSKFKLTHMLFFTVYGFTQFIRSLIPTLTTYLSTVTNSVFLEFSPFSTVLITTTNLYKREEE